MSLINKRKIYCKGFVYVKLFFISMLIGYFALFVSNLGLCNLRLRCRRGLGGGMEEGYNFFVIILDGFEGDTRIYCTSYDNIARVE